MARPANDVVLGIRWSGSARPSLAEKLSVEADCFFEFASKLRPVLEPDQLLFWTGRVPTAPCNRGYEGGFATAMMLKDPNLAQEAAAKAGAATPLGASRRRA